MCRSSGPCLHLRKQRLNPRQYCRPAILPFHVGPSLATERDARVAKPRKIQVNVQSPKVVFNDNGRVTVTFRQHYESGSLKVASTKTMVMVKSGDQWLIQQERVGG
jgi:hypothetical protein